MGKKAWSSNCSPQEVNKQESWGPKAAQATNTQGLEMKVNSKMPALPEKGSGCYPWHHAKRGGTTIMI